MEKNVISLKKDSEESVALKEYINLCIENVLKDIGALRESNEEVMRRVEGFYNNEVKHLRELDKVKEDYQKQLDEEKWKRSEQAINKAEVSMNERMEASNNKYALLKEQNSTFQSQISALPTNKDFDSLQKQVSILTKLVYIGVGGLIVLEFVLKFFGK